MAMKDAIARSSLCLSYQPVIRNPWPKRKSYLFHRAKNIKRMSIDISKVDMFLTMDLSF